jgi:beta-lactamase regulating signal transducer with metallopeptidase domain
MTILAEWASLFVLNAVWQVALVLLAAWAADWLLRRHPAHRHIVWVAAVVLSLLLPLATVWREASPWAATAGPTLAKAVATPARGAAPTAPAGPIWSLPPARWTVVLPENWGRLFLAAVLLFALQRAFLMLRGLAIISHWRRHSQAELPARISAAARQCEAHLRLPPTDIRISNHIVGPVAFGFFQPIVLLPAGFGQEESDDVVLAVLGHEMAHIRRGDYVLNLVCELLLLPLAWHPAVHALRRGLNETREVACDHLAASRVLERHRYARGLLSVAVRIQQHSWAAAQGINDGDILHHRIARLLDRPTPRASAPRLSLATLCLCLASALAAHATLQPGSTATPVFGGAWEGTLYSRHFVLSIAGENGHLYGNLAASNLWRKPAEPLGQSLSTRPGQPPALAPPPPPPPPPPPSLLLPSNAVFQDAAIQDGYARFAMRDDQERLFECVFQLLGPNTAELTLITAGQPAHPLAIRLARKR